MPLSKAVRACHFGSQPVTTDQAKPSLPNYFKNEGASVPRVFTYYLPISDYTLELSVFAYCLSASLGEAVLWPGV